MKPDSDTVSNLSKVIKLISGRAWETGVISLPSRLFLKDYALSLLLLNMTTSQRFLCAVLSALRTLSYLILLTV